LVTAAGAVVYWATGATGSVVFLADLHGKAAWPVK